MDGYITYKFVFKKKKEIKKKNINQLCSNISCYSIVIILELVFKAKLRSYQQQCSQ